MKPMLWRLALGLVAITTIATATTGCSDDPLAVPGSPLESSDIAVQSTSSSPFITTTLPPTSRERLLGRLAQVETRQLVLGARFNERFVGVQLSAIGLSEQEVDCATKQIVLAAGAEFATRPVQSVLSSAGMSPEVLTPCLAIDRMMQLANEGAAADMTRVPADLLRSVITELASAGWESVGLTPVEATCLSTAVVSEYSEPELAAIMEVVQLDATRINESLDNCVTEERRNELGR